MTSKNTTKVQYNTCIVYNMQISSLITYSHWKGREISQIDAQYKGKYKHASMAQQIAASNINNKSQLQLQSQSQSQQ